MTKRNWLMISAICTLGGVSVASAHHGGPGHFDKLDQNKDGVVTAQEFEAHALARFDEGDANKDGKLTPEERKAQHERRMREHFADRDENGDGVLDREELDRMPEEVFKRLDTDNSGTLTPEELRAGFANFKAKHKGKHPGPGPDFESRVISRDEVAKKAREHMQKLDANGDGKLTKDELKPRHFGPRKHGPGHPGKPDRS
jgi:hypothetical protein